MHIRVYRYFYLYSYLYLYIHIYIPAAAMSMSIEGSQKGLNLTCNIPKHMEHINRTYRGGNLPDRTYTSSFPIGLKNYSLIHIHIYMKIIIRTYLRTKYIHRYSYLQTYIPALRANSLSALNSAGVVAASKQSKAISTLLRG
jgi:hypothetical protein